VAIPKKPVHTSNDIGGKHFWAIGYGVWSTGNVTQDVEHHRNLSNKDIGMMILE